MTLGQEEGYCLLEQVVAPKVDLLPGTIPADPSQEFRCGLEGLQTHHFPAESAAWPDFFREKPEKFEGVCIPKGDVRKPWVPRFVVAEIDETRLEKLGAAANFWDRIEKIDEIGRPCPRAGEDDELSLLTHRNPNSGHSAEKGFSEAS